MSEHTQSNALTPLAGLLAEIAKAPPLEHLPDGIRDTACELTHADTGAIGLYDPSTDAIRTAVIRNALPAPFQSALGRGEGLAGYIIANGTAYHGRYGDLPTPVVDAL